MDHKNNNPKNKYMDLLSFRNDIANDLIARSKEQECSCKRGRPTS